MVLCCSTYFILVAQFNYYFNCSWKNKNELLLPGGSSEPRMLKKQPKHLRKYPLHRAALSGIVNWGLHYGRLICIVSKNPVTEKVINTHKSKVDLHLGLSQDSWTRWNLQIPKMDLKGNYKFTASSKPPPSSKTWNELVNNFHYTTKPFSVK